MFFSVNINHDWMVLIPTGAILVVLILIGNALALYAVCKKLETRSARQVPSIISGVIGILFPGSLTMNDSTPEHSRKYNLFGYPAPAGLVNSLGVLSMLMSLALTATFMKNFLEIRAIRQTIRAFPLSFSAAKSLGAAGGLLVLLTALIRVEMMVVMWVIKKKNHSTRICIKRAWSCCSIFTVIFLLMLIATVTVVWSIFKAGTSEGGEAHYILSNFAHSILEQGMLAFSLLQTFLFSSLILYFNWNFGRVNRGDTERAQGVELATSLLSRDDLSSDYHMYNANESNSEVPDENVIELATL